MAIFTPNTYKISYLDPVGRIKAMHIVCNRMKFLFSILMVFVMLSCDDTKEAVVAVVKTESVTVTRSTILGKYFEYGSYYYQ